MSAQIKALNSAIRIETVGGSPIVVASTSTAHPSFTALKADLQGKINDYNAAQGAAVQAGVDAQSVLDT